MAVKIRMMRIGRRHRPFFRINAIENRNQQKGRVLEKLGHYDPLEKDEEKQVVLDLERVKHWLDAGAVPTEAVSQILLRFGIKTKHGQEKTKRRERAKLRARAEGKFFTKAEKVAAEKAQAQEPAEDKSRAAQAAESAPPPETPENPDQEAQADEGDKTKAES